MSLWQNMLLMILIQCSLAWQIQLDCLSDKNWDIVGTSSWLVMISNPRPFWIPQPKLHGARYLISLVKPNNRLVWPVFACCREKVFSSFFVVRDSKIELNNWDELTRMRVTSVTLVRWILLPKKSNKRCFVLIYRWYAHTILSSLHGSAWLPQLTK